MMDAKRLRRTMMFVPGNHPKMINNAQIYGANTLIFDLEDSIPMSQKDAARMLVSHALRELEFPCETAIRVNHLSTPYGLADLEAILPAKPNLIRLPKAESAEEIQRISSMIDEVEKKEGFAEGSIRMMAAIETVKGMRQAYEIATASPRMVAIAIGGEDFIADLQTQRTEHGTELLYARSQLLAAAREAGIQAIDTVYSNLKNPEGFRAEVSLIKDMGFDGKSVVHPSQIEIVNEIYTPTDKEIAHAIKVVAASQEALERGIGVIAVDGKRIDGPLIVRAERIIANAKASGVNIEEVTGR